MTSSPDEIRRDIEQTRRDLATDVDTLHEKVSPSAVAGRKVESAKGALRGAKEKVMGSTSTAGSSSGSGLGTVGGKMSSAGTTVAETAGAAPGLARQQTRGNPLAAGVIAFGAGWLVSSLLPASEKEQQAAVAVKDKASEHSDTLTAPAKQAAQELKDNLKEPAQQAAESVRSTATDAAGTVQDTATSARDDVAGQAKDAKDAVQAR